MAHRMRNLWLHAFFVVIVFDAMLCFKDLLLDIVAGAVHAFASALRKVVLCVAHDTVCLPSSVAPSMCATHVASNMPPLAKHIVG